MRGRYSQWRSLLGMLNEFLFEKIEEEDIRNIWFQEDGAASHTAEAVLLKPTFANILNPISIFVNKNSFNMAPSYKVRYKIADQPYYNVIFCLRTTEHKY